MKQWVLRASTTDHSGLSIKQADMPEPGTGEVRIRVGAIALNARDQMVVRGDMGRTPTADLVPLSDVAGVIDAVGDGVIEWKVGDRVTTAHVPEWTDGPAVPFGLGPGSLDDPGVAAEWVLADQQRLVATPPNLTDIEAATLQVAGVTAWNAVNGDHPVSPGDRVLVIGSGGVSLFAAQIASASGAHVYAAVRSEAHPDQWAAMSVEGVVTTHDSGWGSRIGELAGGVHKVVNTVGPGIVNECLAALTGGGEVAVLGLYDFGPTALDAMTLIGSQATIRGVAVGSVQMHRDLGEFISRHDIHPVIDSVFSFEDLPRALEHQSREDVFGKVVLDLKVGGEG